MRWAYASPHVRYVCEIALDVTELLYVFRVLSSDGQEIIVRELYPYVADVFQRQSAYEADLLAAGFSLEDFAITEEDLPSLQIPLPDQP